MASHETEGLRNLRTTARLAGLESRTEVEVDVEVEQGTGGVGLGPGQGQGDNVNNNHNDDLGDSSSHRGALRQHTFTVVGLGETYNDYTDKIVALHTHLHATHKPTDREGPIYSSSSSASSSSSYLIPDDDVVVIVDAYDVLLLPAVRMAPEFLASSSAPLVFCAENGGYPEFAFASLYQVGWQ